MNTLERTRKAPSLLALLVACASCATPATPAPASAAHVPNIHRVAASPAGLSVNAYLVEGERGVVAIDSALTVSDSTALVAQLIDAAQRGLGLFQAHDYAVAEQLARGELVEVLRDYAAPGPSISLLYAQGRRGSRRVRVFVDFVCELLAPSSLNDSSPARSESATRPAPTRGSALL
jgi:DNA-binding transcriptional LysR family regulator